MLKDALETLLNQILRLLCFLFAIYYRKISKGGTLKSKPTQEQAHFKISISLGIYG